MTHQHDYITDHPRENAAFWRSDLFGGLELLRATYYTHSFGRHIHEGFAIGVIERGAETFFYRGGNFTAGKGTVVLVNPGEIHTGHAADSGGWTYRMFYPSVRLLETLVEQVMARPWSTLYFPTPVVYDPGVAGRLRRLHLLLEQSRSPLEQQNLFYEAFSRLLLRHAAHRPQLEPCQTAGNSVGLATDYLRAHLDENVSLETLARQVGLSPYHFLRLFKQQVGLPPHAYQNHLRIEQAKALLAHGTAIAEVAAQLGYTDQSHLTHRFKQVVGITPGQYPAR